MYTLGINAVFHDSAACIIKDGKLLAAAEEERFTHIKHGKRPVPFSTYELPFHAIDYCLNYAGIHLSEVDHVAYSFDPFILLKDVSHNGHISLPLQPEPSTRNEQDYSEWDPLFLSQIVNAPAQLIDGYPHHLQKRFAGTKPADFSWHFVPHHIAHAASAFYPSPFEKAAVVTIDGRGERATTSYYTGDGDTLTLLKEIHMPHSLGLLYEKITTHLGFLHSSDEYKVMALASYGKPDYVHQFRSMIHVADNGTYTINDVDLEACFGPQRKRNEPFEAQHFNIAHSLQQVLEETVLKLIDWVHETTGMENLCLAGGVALNCVMNARLRDKSAFKQIWVQPAAGDAGTALGAAMWTDINTRTTNKRTYVMQDAYLGPEYKDDEIESFLKWTKVRYKKMTNVARETAALLADDKVIGWYQGRMEFGPRALGGRSILASPLNASMQAKLNEIKDREDFRPVAPVVMEEDVATWFQNGGYSPFMLFVYNVKKDKAAKIPAVTHVDGTARIQTVNRSQHPAYYDLLSEFKKITGVPVLINTSFNTRGEPIVCSPRDAIECFWTSPFDALVINSFLLEK
ncbi:carbamoyltransferase C-terminal domain-containing protein [Danxiaibacter flavus]|uniref:Carbamoyltransferase C-terminal domain-containing protein n=1 Tax=Danxiaibacter flavus TaxID=3049108 RepID=A0ABV3ZIX8_9BACT|nr:carbamoyltransferase C-terminal domain-containing protein [Chitinophagaceae bacterium DXS]